LPESEQTDEALSASLLTTKETEKSIESHAKCPPKEPNTEHPPVERNPSADTVAQSLKSDQRPKSDQLVVAQEQPDTVSEVQAGDMVDSGKQDSGPA